jgi:hypothetical protein
MSVFRIVPTTLRISSLIRYFILATIVNLAAAVAFTTPVIVPEFIFPLKLEIWPGTWMYFSFFAFLTVGVLGTLGWAVLWDLIKKYFGVTETNKYLSAAHFSITELAVYGETCLMFAVGYIGGGAALIGIPKEEITQGLIGWMVVPIGIFILLYLVGTLLGIANLALAIVSRPNSLQVEERSVTSSNISV